QYTVTFMSKIQRRDFDIFSFDVIPDIKLRPVTYWKNTYVFALLNTSVKNTPKFRTLSLRIPLTEFISHCKNSFFRSSLFFIPASTSTTSIKLLLFDSLQKSYSLQRVPAGILTLLFNNPSFINRILHQTDNQFLS